MFKSVRWRCDKNNKIKAVFKLQFHATQVSQFVGDTLMISAIPADVGKPTVRLEKVTVREGSCYWEKPIYETVKLIRDPKTGKIHEKIYHFVVSAGSSKIGLVGEVLIDFANYAAARKLSSVSLPLKNTKSEAVLHVSVQRMADSTDQGEIEESENAELYAEDRSLRAQLGNDDVDASIKSNSTEDVPFNKNISLAGELNGKRRESSVSDITISSSESFSFLDTPRELGTKTNNDTIGLPSLHQKPIEDASTTIYEEHQRSHWEWLGGSASEESMDDSMSSPRETLLKEISNGDSDFVIEKLKTEFVALARQADMSELELQTLRKQVVKESKRGNDLLREIASLKEERDAFKDECELLRSSSKARKKPRFDGGDPWVLVEELREEVNYEKGLNANLRLQLQKTQDSNSELILAVQDLEEMLEQKTREMVCSNQSEKCEMGDDDEEQRELEELVKEQKPVKESYLLEQKIADLYNEVEIYKREKDDLEMQMEQLALDYEILKQENHEISCKLERSELQDQLKMQYECSTSYETFDELEEKIESLENELKNRSKEFSDSLVTIKNLENHVKSLEKELENQAHGFEADLEELTHTKIEVEKRAIKAEETLRKARLQNANTAERLQEEFRRLSMQMASTFDAHEKLAVAALNEANVLRLEKCSLEELLEKAKEDIETVRDFYEAKLVEVSSEITLKMARMEQMELEIENKSVEIELQMKKAEETQRVFSKEIVMHKDEIERLKTENDNILFAEAKEKESLRAELEQLKASIKELERTIALMKKELNEKESLIGHLKLEVGTLKVQCDDSKRSSFECELEKEKLRKQILQLKGDLKKKEDAFISTEKKLKNIKVLEGTKATSRSNKATVVPHGSKEAANLKERIKLLEGEIKLKEIALETSVTSFSEKENDLRNKIGDLERRLEVLGQNSASFCGTEFEKVARESELLNEMAILKEKNKSMERELKEMQERYSAISLKFAEVEGERQQLVMTLRNLKNPKRT
ncbi:hypothetical protein LguiB_028833 [Lonicera macranthoides]